MKTSSRVAAQIGRVRHPRAPIRVSCNLGMYWYPIQCLISMDPARSGFSHIGIPLRFSFADACAAMIRIYTQDPAAIQTPSRFPMSPRLELFTPYHRTDEELILQSVDGGEIRAHIAVLSLASCVFQDMFQHAKPAPSSDGDWKDGIPIVRLTESSCTIRAMLSIFQSAFDPSHQSWARDMSIDSTLR